MERLVPGFEFRFSEKAFEKLFPYFVTIDSNGAIVAFGKSIAKLTAINSGDRFEDIFNFVRPNLAFFPASDVNIFEQLIDNLVVLSLRNNSNQLLRGQFELLDDNLYLFAGTPWFDSIEKMTESNLYINDFAIHDPIVDLLHIIQIKEIANKDVKKLLEANRQQNILLKNNEAELLGATNRLTHLISNLESGVLVEDENRNIVLANSKFFEIFGLEFDSENYKNLNCAGYYPECERAGNRSGIFCKDCLGISRSISDLFVAPDIFLAATTATLSSKQKRIDEVFQLKDGRIISRDFIPVRIGEDFKGLLWKYTDVTATKMAEHKLAEQKRFYEQILNEIPADIAVLDASLRYMFVNPVSVRDEGVRKWIIGKTDAEYFSFKNKDSLRAVQRQASFKYVVENRTQTEWEETTVLPNFNSIRFFINSGSINSMSFFIAKGRKFCHKKEL
jgi:two-component system, sensor histidine kinase